jgi:hypothetical protein
VKKAGFKPMFKRVSAFSRKTVILSRRKNILSYKRPMKIGMRCGAGQFRQRRRREIFVNREILIPRAPSERHIRGIICRLCPPYGVWDFLFWFLQICRAYGAGFGNRIEGLILNSDNDTLQAVVPIGNETELMPLLDENAYRKTFGKEMVRVSADGNAPFPFWNYVEQIPEADFQGFDCSAGSVQWVWRDEGGRFEHILIDAEQGKDVFMVVVLDLVNKEVIGHRLMDFKGEYGLRDS